VQLPVDMALHRSFLWRRMALLCHLVAAGVVWLPRWPFWLPPGLDVLLILSAALVWWGADPPLAGLRLGREGDLAVSGKDGEGYQAARLLPGAIAYPWLVVMGLESNGVRYRLALWPDSATAEDFRRLRVWLRWRAAVSGRGRE